MNQNILNALKSRQLVVLLGNDLSMVKLANAPPKKHNARGSGWPIGLSGERSEHIAHAC